MNCRVVVLSLLMSGCLVATSEAPEGKPEPMERERVTEPERTASATGPAYSEATQAPSCANAGQACGEGETCCAGTYCFGIAFTYAPPVCRSLLPDGSECFVALECQSGACTTGRCGTAACAAEGLFCEVDSDCCAGSFCFNFTYAPFACRPKRAVGERCYADSNCTSGRCNSMSECAP